MIKHRLLLRIAGVAALLCLLTMFSALASGAQGTVTSSSLVLRASASKKSKAIATLEQGDRLEVCSESDGWYKVYYGKKSGYVMKDYVKVSGSVKSASDSKKSSSSKNDSSDSQSDDTPKKISDIGSAPSATKPGSSGKNVKKLQQALSILGYYNGKINGKYDDKTTAAVKAFQKAHGLDRDGVAGSKTIAAIFGTGSSSSSSNSSNNSSSSSKYKTERLNWFKNGSRTIPKGAVFTVKDVKTGKTFKVKRWSGSNHIDAEPLTKEDAKTMKSIYGGYSWRRRAILVKYNGHVYAASMNGMPHGTTTISSNSFDGHFCIHFYGSKTHGTKRVDREHQNQVDNAMRATW